MSSSEFDQGTLVVFGNNFTSSFLSFKILKHLMIEKVNYEKITSNV